MIGVIMIDTLLGLYNMPLAINNIIGQNHDINGRLLSETFANQFDLRIIQGPSNQPAPIDAILYRDNVIVGVLESRTRKTHSHRDIQSMGNTFLVTHQKLIDLMYGGKLFGVPSYLVIQMACGTRWVWKVGDEKGLPRFSWKVNRTQTKATSLDDRQILRDNAYIPLNEGRMW